MNSKDWEIIYEMLGIIAELTQNSSNYSKHLAERIEALGKKIEEMETDE